MEPERISVPQKNIGKFKQVLLYVLNKIGAEHGVDESVLHNLLYFIDLDYYELYEEQLMGMQYIKKDYGATPIYMEQIKYSPVFATDLSLLSAHEIKHVDHTLQRLSGKSAIELATLARKDVPWIAAKPGGEIKYNAVFYRNEDTSVRIYSKGHLVCPKQTLVFQAFADYEKPEKRCLLLYPDERAAKEEATASPS
jgi:hypothetical protein